MGLSGVKEYGDPFDEIRGSCPLLWRAMTETKAGPDHLKEPCKLLIRCVPGGAYASLSDETFGWSLDASSDTLGGCFAALETNLALDQPPIRYWQKHEIQAKKKKKVNT